MNPSGVPRPKNLTRPGKKFTLATGIIFLALYAGILAVEWTTLRGQAVNDAEEKAREITQLLVGDLGLRAPLSRLLGMSGPEDAAVYRTLDQEIRARVRQFGLQDTKVYDRNGTILYAEDRGLIGRNFSDRRELRLALAGKVASRVLSPRQYRRFYGAASHSWVVETYVPLKEPGGAKTQYVFESYQNFEPALARTKRLVAMSGLTLAGLVLLGLGAVGLIYRRIQALKGHVEILEGLLPICSSCKKIRVGDETSDQWMPVEEYFQQRDRVSFTHGLCKECLKSRLDEVEAMRKSRSGAGA